MLWLLLRPDGLPARNLRLSPRFARRLLRRASRAWAERQQRACSVAGLRRLSSAADSVSVKQELARAAVGVAACLAALRDRRDVRVLRRHVRVAEEVVS